MGGRWDVGRISGAGGSDWPVLRPKHICLLHQLSQRLNLLIRNHDLLAPGRSRPRSDGRHGGGADDVSRGAGLRTSDAARARLSMLPLALIMVLSWFSVGFAFEPSFGLKCIQCLCRERQKSGSDHII
jgi:hypothetical protein